MTIIPQNECCQMLGIHPKTLRHWLAHAQMPFTTHPTDARLRCLTQAQVQQLAALHGRPLASPLTAPPAQEQEAVPPAVPAPLGSSGQAATDLSQSLARLQAQVATMQEQLTQLALEVLRERDLRLTWLGAHQPHNEARLSTREAPVLPVREPSPSPPAEPSPRETDLPPAQPSHVLRSSRSGSARGRSQVLPLIAWTATESYVIICPTRGELPLVPDSPEWFDWLATLSSFRFIGKLGRLSASRNRGRPCWMAYRRIHGHCYAYGLGNTKRLTIAHLEQMAATLQSHVPPV